MIGNPPWKGVASQESPAGQWASSQEIKLPNKQIATAFIRKASNHTNESGKVCLVLPTSILFNLREKAIAFQREWLTEDTLECVVNLADYQRFLFEAAGYPAIIVRYRDEPVLDPGGKAIQYWCPKSDWSVTKAELIRIASDDRNVLLFDEVLRCLESDDAPNIWKRYFWGTNRDRRFLDRLSDLPRLRGHVRQTREKNSKPWIIAQGFEPVGSCLLYTSPSPRD